MSAFQSLYFSLAINRFLIWEHSLLLQSYSWYRQRRQQGATTAVCTGALGRDIRDGRTAGVSCRGWIFQCDFRMLWMSAAYIFQPECRARHYDGSYQPFYDSDGGIDFDPCFVCSRRLERFFNSLPQAVLGGCTVMMFGSIMYEGIKMLKGCVFDDRTMIIVSLAFCIGVGLTQTSGNFFAAFPKRGRRYF